MGEIMGKKLQKKAKALGLTNLPGIFLYARPTKIFRGKTGMDQLLSGFVSSSTFTPNIALILLEYCEQKFEGSSFKFGHAGSGGKKMFFYLAPESNFYMELTDRSSFVQFKAKNHISQIIIYTDNQELVRDIALRINQLFDEGVINELDWEKAEKKFKVKREDCITTWKAVLQ
jgi:hypothetical protein